MVVPLKPTNNQPALCQYSDAEVGSGEVTNNFTPLSSLREKASPSCPICDHERQRQHLDGGPPPKLECGMCPQLYLVLDRACIRLPFFFIPTRGFTNRYEVSVRVFGLRSWYRVPASIGRDRECLLKWCDSAIMVPKSRPQYFGSRRAFGPGWKGLTSNIAGCAAYTSVVSWNEDAHFHVAYIFFRLTTCPHASLCHSTMPISWRLLQLML